MCSSYFLLSLSIFQQDFWVLFTTLLETMYKQTPDYRLLSYHEIHFPLDIAKENLCVIF